MWYQGDEDEELCSIIENIEKKEIQQIKDKIEKKQQQQQDQLSLSSSSLINNTLNNNNNNNDNKMSSNNNNNEPPRTISTSNDFEISNRSDQILSPSPSFISSSQDVVFNIEQLPSPPESTKTNLNSLSFKDVTSDTTTASNDNPLKQSTISIVSNQNNNNNSNNNNANASTTNQPALQINFEIPTEIPKTAKAIEEGKQVFVNFLKAHTCYDVIPISGKVVVLDTKLAVKSAFYALEENGIKSAPLWNSEQHDFTGMITVSDFIDILLYYYRKPRSNNIFQDMGMHRIETFWREISVERPSSLISTEPETNLYDAASLLLCYKIHRLPVVDRKDTNSILHILTHSRILAFMMKSLPQLPEKLLSVPLGSLGIGTFATVVTVMTHTPLVEVLELLSAKKISAVPIIDSETSKIVDVYSKSDVTLMSKQGVLSPSDLNLPVHQVLSTFTKLWQRPEQIYTCTRYDKLGDVIEKCIKKRVHRLVCIDSSKKVEGIISLSDILNYLLNDVKHIC
ncbi:hypothetical protein DICPUDRAFT_90836 [Dictyostelium purpureum]|uniref:CBS domain-containing protein n=1 Tax=Dictyostelium purpureum TaxID=5786 RepID=F1A546_DICPU|nr:uncharacterized protein DICPUDRAFT_90836 [Dictyostelium purpureum]EGC28681.1 hypothetical protein DICPUDRAFT_90836 [Dictyostelium purpureum]|eukprot:XP_003294792.1 hypothetical protein DICPUDRAFT_90836 [Dictyostelium purpureum]